MKGFYEKDWLLNDAFSFDKVAQNPLNMVIKSPDTSDRMILVLSHCCFLVLVALKMKAANFIMIYSLNLGA